MEKRGQLVCRHEYVRRGARCALFSGDQLACHFGFVLLGFARARDMFILLFKNPPPPRSRPAHPIFKLQWLFENVPTVRAAQEQHRLAFGGIESWLHFCFTERKVARHVTDITCLGASAVRARLAR